MTSLHFTDPKVREYGAASDDRVHKSFFYGSKHIDQYVPPVNPNARMVLMNAKASEWAAGYGNALSPPRGSRTGPCEKSPLAPLIPSHGEVRSGSSSLRGPPRRL